MPTDGALRGGPLDSRRIRGLLYAAEGMMLAGILYLCVFIVATLISVFLSDTLTETQIVVIGLFFSIGVLLALRDFWAITQFEPQSFYAEWMEIRRWYWLVAIAIPLALLLIGLASSLLGLRWMFQSHLNYIIGSGLLATGLMLRIFVRYIAGSGN